MIPRILFQTSLSFPDDRYVRTMIKHLGEDWIYLHYTDETALKFFDSNPLSEFPHIREKFLAVSGANRADIFRLYFLRLRGGVYMESDAVLLDELNKFILGSEFVTIRSVDKRSIFPGILAAIPNHPIIESALKFAYESTVEDWQKDYHLSCNNLADIIDNDRWNARAGVKIYREIGDPHNSDRFISVGDRGECILSHFPRTKIIPEELLV